MGRKAGRDVKGMYVMIVGLCVSTVFAIVAAALPATSEALVGVKVSKRPTHQSRGLSLRDLSPNQEAVGSENSRAVVDDMVQIALFYSCILVEILCVWFLLNKNLHRRVRTERIAERYGAFTLIIL
jgi:hypothetical protein